MTELTVAHISLNDVLLGRGKRIHNWQGNVRFRQVIAERCVSYHLSNDAKRREAIAKELFDVIKSQRGRFLRPWNRAKDNATTTEHLLTNTWKEVCEQDALRKIRQALRDSGAKVIAAKGGNPKKRCKIEDNSTPEPLPFTIIGEVGEGQFASQAGVTTMPIQQLPTPMPSTRLQLLAPTSSVSYDSCCPVALRRSYTLDSTRQPELPVFRPGNNGLAATEVITHQNQLVAADSIGPLTAVEAGSSIGAYGGGVPTVATPFAASLSRPVVQLRGATGEAVSSSQSFGVQEIGGHSLSEGFSSSEIQMIDEALSQEEQDPPLTDLLPRGCATRPTSKRSACDS